MTDNREGFVFYRSFWQVFRTMPSADVQTLLNALCAYALDGKEPELQYPLSGFFVQMRANVDASQKRYDKAVGGGNKGGRPSKQNFIPTSVWISAIEEHGSVPKAAKALGLSANTLRSWVNASDDPRVQKLKNLNVNVNDTVNENETVLLTNKKSASAERSQSDTPRRKKEKSVDVWAELLEREAREREMNGAGTELDTS